MLKIMRKRDTSNCDLGSCAENKPSIQFRAVNTKIGDGVNDSEQQNREQDLKKKKSLDGCHNGQQMTSAFQCKFKTIILGRWN